MKTIARHTLTVAACYLLSIGSAQAETIRCPASVWAPPHAGSADQVVDHPGWQALWHSDRGDFKKLDIYDETPEVDLVKRGPLPGYFSVLSSDQFTYPVQAVHPWFDFRTKDRSGTYMDVGPDNPRPTWMACHYANMTYVLYREVLNMTRCENYRKLDGHGHPIGPVIGECK